MYGCIPDANVARYPTTLQKVWLIIVNDHTAVIVVGHRSLHILASYLQSVADPRWQPVLVEMETSLRRSCSETCVHVHPACHPRTMVTGGPPERKRSALTYLLQTLRLDNLHEAFGSSGTVRDLHI